MDIQLFHGLSNTFPFSMDSTGFFQWFFRFQLLGKFLSGWCSDGGVANTTQSPNRDLGTIMYYPSHWCYHYPIGSSDWGYTVVLNLSHTRVIRHAQHRHLWRNKSQHQTKNRCIHIWIDMAYGQPRGRTQVIPSHCNTWRDHSVKKHWQLQHQTSSNTVTMRRDDVQAVQPRLHS